MIAQEYNRIESEEIETFERGLAEKVLRSREAFFYKGVSWLERKENEEVKQREARGDREFNYRNSISTFLQNLSSVEPEKREKIMKAVLDGVYYKITGVYVEGLSRTSRNNSPLLADVASNPLEYL